MYVGNRQYLNQHLNGYKGRLDETQHSRYIAVMCTQPSVAMHYACSLPKRISSSPRDNRREKETYVALLPASVDCPNLEPRLHWMRVPSLCPLTAHLNHCIVYTLLHIFPTPNVSLFLKL